MISTLARQQLVRRIERSAQNPERERFAGPQLRIGAVGN
jgi:hypothetical protein